MAPSNHPLITGPVAVFMAAMNNGDLDGVVAAFAPDALVNDQLHDHWGDAAIRAWAAADLIGDAVQMAVVQVIARHDNVTVTAHVDGNFDKRGLREPLVLTLYFNIHRNRIAQLIVLHNLNHV